MFGAFTVKNKRPKLQVEFVTLQATTFSICETQNQNKK